MSRWKVALAVGGAPDIAQSRLLQAHLEGVAWYRRQGRLMVTAVVKAVSQHEAEKAGVQLIGAAHVQATVVRSKQLDR